MMRSELSLRRLDRASTVLCALALAALAAVATVSLAGRMLLVERSDSMRPALSAGDLLMTDGAPAGAIRTGDVVTFADAARGDRLITHRVVAIKPGNGSIVFTTRGDANTGSESFAVGDHDTVQRLSSRARGVGGAAMALARIPGWVLLVAALALLATPSILRRRRYR
jgi:signal peptidase